MYEKQQIISAGAKGSI